jgi:phage tail-like protein
MPVERKDQRPYMQFNFQLQINGQDVGGFQEISGLGTEVAVTEYRHGNEQQNNVRKLSGLNKASDVTLKRGILGTETLFSWIDGIRKGNASDLRTVKIELLSEDRTTVMTWNLIRARPMKLSYGPLNAKGSDVAMEEIVLAYEILEME